MLNLNRSLCILAVVALGGCGVIPRQFTVETQPVLGNEPLIYTPGTNPGASISILIPDVTMECGVATKPGSAGNGTTRANRVERETYSFRLSQSLVAQRDLGRESLSLYAIFEPDAYRTLVAALAAQPKGNGAQSIRADLVRKVERAAGQCELKFRSGRQSVNADVVSQYTAERILHGLPRAFSNVAGIAFNQRMTGQSTATSGVNDAGFSLDISAGMRLRLENSLPIAPDGVNSERVNHPSSIAAPSYLYFNPVTAPQVCANYFDNKERKVCETKAHDEMTLYLSPSAEMLRYGARQDIEFDLPDLDDNPNKVAQKSTDGESNENKAKEKDRKDVLDESAVRRRGLDVSSVIDLMERRNHGIGLWRHWRLWSPYSRGTAKAIKLGTDWGGSPDSPDGPILIAADDIATLDGLVTAAAKPQTGAEANTQNQDGKRPCMLANDDKSFVGDDKRTTWQCYYLHYRVIPIPEIVLRVNGAERWVPVGTTLHDIVAPLFHADLFQGYATAGYYDRTMSATDSVLLERSRQRVLRRLRIMRRFDGELYPLRPDTLEVREASSRFLRLQLLPGDEISW